MNTMQYNLLPVGHNCKSYKFGKDPIENAKNLVDTWKNTSLNNGFKSNAINVLFCKHIDNGHELIFDPGQDAQSKAKYINCKIKKINAEMTVDEKNPQNTCVKLTINGNNLQTHQNFKMDITVHRYPEVKTEIQYKEDKVLSNCPFQTGTVEERNWIANHIKGPEADEKFYFIGCDGSKGVPDFLRERAEDIKKWVKKIATPEQLINFLEATTDSSNLPNDFIKVEGNLHCFCSTLYAKIGALVLSHSRHSNNKESFLKLLSEAFSQNFFVWYEQKGRDYF